MWVSFFVSSRSPSKDLYWFQYYLLDVAAFCISVALAILFVVWKVLSCCCGLFCGRQKEKEE